MLCFITKFKADISKILRRKKHYHIGTSNGRDDDTRKYYNALCNNIIISHKRKPVVINNSRRPKTGRTPSALSHSSRCIESILEKNQCIRPD